MVGRWSCVLVLFICRVYVSFWEGEGIWVFVGQYLLLVFVFKILKSHRSLKIQFLRRTSEEGRTCGRCSRCIAHDPGDWYICLCLLWIFIVHVFGKSTVGRFCGILHGEQIFRCREGFFWFHFFPKTLNINKQTKPKLRVWNDFWSLKKNRRLGGKWIPIVGKVCMFFFQDCAFFVVMSQMKQTDDHLVVSKNSGFTPKSIGFSMIFTIHFGVPLFL